MLNITEKKWKEKNIVNKDNARNIPYTHKLNKNFYTIRQRKH